MSATQPDLIVTLVHGTWGRGFFFKSDRVVPTSQRRWFEPGSDFVRSLDATLAMRGAKADVRPFRWSGANSFYERSAAATRLAEELSSQAKIFPSSARVVIAHSHGGNIALRALMHLDPISDVRVITLATPFVQLFALASVNPRIRALKINIWLLTLLFTLVFAGSVTTVWPTGYDYWPFSVLHTSALSLPPANRPLLSEILSLTTLAICLVLAWLAVGRNMLRFSGIDVPKASKRHQRFDVGKLVAAAAYAAQDRGATEMLVLRGVDDEASLVLSAGAAGVRLSHFFLSITAYIGLPVVSVSFLLLLFLTHGAMAKLDLTSISWVLRGTLLFVMCWAFFCLLIAVLPWIAELLTQ